MSDSLLPTYHRLPPLVRSALASVRGLTLRRWRYGPETERLVVEACEHECWLPQQWDAWQQERLAFVLHRAATQVPYYRERWAERRCRGDRASWESLENWPVLEKDVLRANPKAFVADDCDTRRMFEEHTSGTTGKPLRLWMSRETVRAWYALFEARWREWHGVSRHDRWAILGGQMVVSVRQRKPPFWVWNAAMNQLYMSSYHLAPDLIPYYLEAMERYRVRYLYGYTSALNSLAQSALRTGWRATGIQVAITNAEPVYGYQREAIGEAFGCPVRETYGMSEMAAAAGECEQGRMHLWPEAGWVEVLEDGRPVAPGETGDLVATGLINADMPLIRHRVGDRVALAEAGDSCRCGRTLPLMKGVEGRCDDVLYTADGRQVGRLDPVFKSDLPIREAQIIQESLGRVRLRYAPDGCNSPSDTRRLVSILRERLGEVEVVLEPVEAIPRGANGKFRAVVCQVPPEARPVALQRDAL